MIDAALAYAAAPGEPLAVLAPYPRGNPLRGDPDSPAWQAFERHPVRYEGQSEATIGDFIDAIEHGSRDTPFDRRNWLEMIFRLHYCFELDEGDGRVGSWRGDRP